MKINVLVFDLDDTLYREEDYVRSGFTAVDKWLEINEGTFGFYGVATELFNAGEKRKIFNRALEQLNIAYDQYLINKMVDVYRQHKPRIELLEDAIWIFDQIKSTTKLGIITDGYLVTQKQKVKALGLKEKFQSIIISDLYGKDCWKPSSTPYENAVKELNCSHHESVYIGDNLSKDFITAKKLGWTTVHINRTNGIYSDVLVSEEHKAHHEITSLKELTKIETLKHMFIRT